jgi:hypothetical protein
VRETRYVDACPQCNTTLVGVTPQEYREEHAPECNPLAGLYVFPAGTEHRGASTEEETSEKGSIDEEIGGER